MFKKWALCLMAVLLLTSNIAFAANNIILQLGDKGSDVITVQNALKLLGYLNEFTVYTPAEFDECTKQAVQRFQQDANMKKSGVVDSDTLSKLTGRAGIVRTVHTDQSVPHLFAGNYKVMSTGSHGARVVVLQQALNELGYTIDKIDGIYGRSTEQAVMAFQTTEKLYVDGIAGPYTLAQLEYRTQNKRARSGYDLQDIYVVPTRTLRMDKKGTDVGMVQRRLSEMGYYDRKITEVYDNYTYQAVKDFQKTNNLTVDGVCGARTLAVMFSLSAVCAHK